MPLVPPISAVAPPEDALITLVFQLGGASLELRSNSAALVEEFLVFYGDCTIDRPEPDAFRIGCTAWRELGTESLTLQFTGSHLPHPVDAMLGFFQVIREKQYAEQPCRQAGWRQIRRDDGAQFLASDGADARISMAVADYELVVNCIVTMVQCAQPGVLFVHSGSVGIAGRGALIIGGTGGGKSTLALTLAIRGHRFLGDDVAAVRLATRELLPFPKSAGLRDGPVADELGPRIEPGRYRVAPARDGRIRTLLRVRDFFPWNSTAPVPLTYAFVLGPRSDRARLRPFEPHLGELDHLKSMVIEAVPSWGASPGRDLMKFLTVIDLLSGLRCYLLESGTPHDSARVIEEAMEEACT